MKQPHAAKMQSAVAMVERLSPTPLLNVASPQTLILQPILLARLLTSWQTIAVASVHTNRALCLVLEEPEVGVIGGSLTSDASTSTDETWADVDGVCVARLHVNRRERRERTWCRLVVVGGVSVGAGAWVVASPEEGPAALVLEG